MGSGCLVWRLNLVVIKTGVREGAGSQIVVDAEILACKKILLPEKQKAC